MKNLLFTKSAGLIDDALEGAGVAPKSTPAPAPTPAPAAPPANPSSAVPTSDSSGSLGAWFDRNRGKIGTGLMGAGAGMLLATYVLDRKIKDLEKELQKKENQKEENNKTE